MGKTRLEPAEQWDRSAAYFERYNDPDDGLCASRMGEGDHCSVYLLQILIPHRLFLPGDVLPFELTNGAARRGVVWGVSSKGYPIERFYLNFQRWQSYRDGKYHGHSHIPDGTPRLAIRKFVDAPHRVIFDLPDELAGKRPTDPVVREFVLESLCAGTAVRRVSADSPALSPWNSRDLRRAWLWR